MAISDSTLKNVCDYFEVVPDCSGKMVFKVLDIRGRIAKTMNESVQDARQNLSLQTNDLRRGKYIINIFSNGSFIKSVPYTKI